MAFVPYSPAHCGHVVNAGAEDEKAWWLLNVPGVKVLKFLTYPHKPRS